MILFDIGYYFLLLQKAGGCNGLMTVLAGPYGCWFCFFAVSILPVAGGNYYSDCAAYSTSWLDRDKECTASFLQKSGTGIAVPVAFVGASGGLFLSELYG
ncbi:MAG: hypothetical protein ACLTLY_06015 [Agathobacter rectalis]